MAPRRVRRRTPSVGEASDLVPTLAVCISTIGKRLNNLRPDRLSPCPGVRYYVLVQEADKASDPLLARLAQRPDIQVRRVEGKG